jgi:L-alanine-DL-glutamate epimerase-like enolase superfamily enzyme
MRIVDLQACTASIPLETPTTFATRVVAERHFTIVRLRREDGIEGLGYCYIGNKAGHLGTIAVRDLLRESVVGRDSNQVEQIWDAMFRDTLLQGRRGLVLRAMSAIDNALWDANAKAAGLPLYKYLGGFRENTVPTYASGGYYYKDKTPADLAREVAGYVDVGFRAVKIKVGRLSAEEDAKRVKAAREAIGPNVQLFLDVNNGWNDAPTAIKAVKMFEPYDPGWIEEPFPPDEFDLFAALASSIDTPIATGEIENGHWGFKVLLDKKGVDIFQPDVGVCGGVTEFRKIAHLATAHGVTVAPHSRQELHVHLVASTPNATWLEYFTDVSITNIALILSTKLEVRDGQVVIPDRPGFGIELDEEALAKYSVDGWA